jgi:hypothetical protein
MSNAQEYKNYIDAIATALRSATESFVALESQLPGQNVHTATVAANDMLYKYLTNELKQKNREAMENIPDGTHWQASDGTVFEKSASDSVHLTLADYRNKVCRTIRPGEDRTGFLPLAVKRAAELGYIVPKE